MIEAETESAGDRRKRTALGAIFERVGSGFAGGGPCLALRMARVLDEFALGQT